MIQLQFIQNGYKGDAIDLLVFPAASKPSIRILISFFPESFANSLENALPILAALDRGIKMASFPVDLYVSKLRKLVPSQEAIETLSHWMIHYKRFVKQVVYYWNYEMIHSHIYHQISLLYLANDVIQNTRKKDCKFIAEFATVLPQRIDDLYGRGTGKIREKITRMVGIWQERNLFSSVVIEKLFASMKHFNEEAAKTLPSFLISSHGKMDKLCSLWQKSSTELSRMKHRMTFLCKYPSEKNNLEFKELIVQYLKVKESLYFSLQEASSEEKEEIEAIKQHSIE